MSREDKEINELIRKALDDAKRVDINVQLNMMKMNIQNAEEALVSLQYEFKKLKEML